MSFKENAFPIGKGKIELTSGTRTDNLVYWCRADGTLTFTFEDDTTKVVTLITGEAIRPEATIKSVTITTGTFNLA